jgi:hypothetical protein
LADSGFKIFKKLGVEDEKQVIEKIQTRIVGFSISSKIEIDDVGFSAIFVEKNVAR